MKTSLKVLFALLISPAVFASGYHGEINTSTTVNNLETEKPNGSAMAMAASNIHLDPRYIPWQGAVAVGTSGGRDALLFAAGKRPCKTCAFISGSVGGEGENLLKLKNLSAGAGYSAKF